MWQSARLGALGVGVLLMFALMWGWTTAQDFPLDDKREQLGTEFFTMGRIEPIDDQQFPKKWGRLADYTPPDQSGGLGSTLVFEAEDGTIRIVKLVMNWTTYRVESASVFTIGRE